MSINIAIKIWINAKKISKIELYKKIIDIICDEKKSFFITKKINTKMYKIQFNFKQFICEKFCFFRKYWIVFQFDSNIKTI